jgi:hypothetical protein
MKSKYNNNNNNNNNKQYSYDVREDACKCERDMREFIERYSVAELRRPD